MELEAYHLQQQICENSEFAYNVNNRRQHVVFNPMYTGGLHMLGKSIRHCRAPLLCVRHSCYKFCSVYVSTLVRACVLGFVHLSGFVLAITSTFMHGFQNNLAQLLSLRS